MQERAERRRKDREHLQLAAEQLLSSEGWKRWVRVRLRAGLARLSITNQLLVALVKPDATFVAGYNACSSRASSAQSAPIRLGQPGPFQVSPWPSAHRGSLLCT